MTSPWPITSRSSKVVCERIKLNKTDVISLIIHALKNIAENVCKKRQQPKQSNVRFLSRQKMSQLFPLDIFGRVWGQKPTGRTWAHRTETEIRTKAHRLIFFSLLSLLCRYSYLLHLSIPLIISSHASIGVCLSVVFHTTQDSSVCPSVSYSAPHEMADNASESWYSTTVFVSLY